MALTVFRPCAACGGCGAIGVARCKACDGIGRVLSPGGPSFGCTIRLADRFVGEIVQLGTGERVKISWFEPRRNGKTLPVVAFVAELDAFDDHPHDNPTPIPATVGVREVIASRFAAVEVNDRAADHLDPIFRASSAGRQGMP